VLAFVILGLASGSVYALAGLGLVLTYKTSGIFNFAHGALAAVAAYVFYSLFVLAGWPWPLAAIIAIAVAGPVMGLALEFLARGIQGSPLTLRVAATVGVLLVVEAAIYLIYGTQTTRTVPVFLGAGTIRVGGASVQVAQIVTFGFVVVATAGLTGYLRWTRTGIAMRALVDDVELLDAAGTSPAATRRMAWMIGVTLAAASGVLFAPLEPLDPVQLTLLVASAFGAAAIGAFTSLPMTFAGGLAIGVLAALCTKWFPGTALLGLPPAVPFIALFVVVLFFPKSRVRGSPPVSAAQRASNRGASPLHLTVAAVMLAGLLLVPSFAGVHMTDWTTFLATSIVFMSLGLFVRTAGQIVLCQVAFMAVGAAAFSHLALGGVPWLVALGLAGLVAVPIGLALSIPAIRLPGLYLALATFAFGIVAQDVFYSASYMFGTSGLGVNEPRPHLSWWSIGTDRGFYYVVLAIAGLVAALVVALTRGRFGRLLRRIGETPAAVQTSGAAISVTRMVVFAMAAFLASIGGALAGVSQGTVIADSYQPFASLTYLAAIVIVPGGAALSAVLAAAGLTLIPSYIPGFRVGTVIQLIFGASVVVYAMLPPRLRSTPRFRRSTIGRWVGRRPPAIAPKTRTNQTASSVGPRVGPIRVGGLTVRDVTVRLGGRTILDGASLTAEPGRITGLIGANGAGKTTLINACAGQLRPTRGHVALGEIELTRHAPSSRARLGLRRTFQRPELFDSLNVRQNVEAGVEAALAGLNPLTHLRGRRGDRSSIRAVSDRAIDLCGLGPDADVPMVQLSPGRRKLVELARCLSGPCQLLLLDEPCAGLDGPEQQRIGQVLRQVVAERGVGVLLVEHDMAFALDVCQHVYVLDSGRVIFQGSPRAVVSSELVQTTYLGGRARESPGAVDPVAEPS
jgi:ABC-type branched-subunit amino acid transport system ATPase component/branched-subunit amino acid ABC-type transport system permease component